MSRQPMDPERPLRDRPSAAFEGPSSVRGGGRYSELPGERFSRRSELPASPQGAPKRVFRVEVSAGTLFKTACAAGVVWLLIQLWPIVLVLAVSLMLVGVLAPPIAWLERRVMRRGAAVAAVFVGIFVAFGLFAALTFPSLCAEVVVIAERLPQTQEEVAAYLQKSTTTAPLAKSVRATGLPELAARGAQMLLASSSQIVEVVAYAVTCLFLALYLILDRDRMRGALFSLVPRGFHVRLSRILLNFETIVGGYARGQFITSVMMAVFTFLVLTALRVPNAVALAAFAGVTDVLPYVGGMLACGPATLAAWSRGLPSAVTVLVLLTAYQEFESRLVVPRIYGRALRLPAATVMVALLVGGRLLGILGALLALPVAAGIRMIIEELRFELPGEDFDDAAMRKRDAREEHAFARLAAGAPAEQAAAIAAEIAEARLNEDVAGDEPMPILK